MRRAVTGCLGLAVAAAAACSLTTDLSGFTSGSNASGAAPNDAPSGDAPAEAAPPDGAAPDAGPFHPRYERRLTIDAAASPAVADGASVCVAVPAAVWSTMRAGGKVEDDLGDLRVFGPTGERDRAIDVHQSGIATVCFRLARAIAAGAKDDGYALRYGDASASAPPAADADVFDFFDGFDEPTLASRWRTAGAPLVASGTLRLRSGDNAITDVAADDGLPAEASLEIRASVSDPTSEPTPTDAGTFYYWFGFQHQGDFVASEPWSVFIARGKASVGAEHKTTSGTCQPGCASATAPQGAGMRTYRIDRTNQNVRFTSDDGVTYDAAGSNGDMSIMVRNFLQSGEVDVDFVRARRVAAPEPTMALGDETALP